MRVLMCRPEFYGVYYEINPWMKVSNQPDTVLAARQWQELYDTYLRLGVEVELIDPREGLPDMVFTANGGFVSGDLFVRSNFRHPQRRQESEFFEEWFAARGYRIVRLPSEHSFEGAGDVKSYRDILFAGFHFRSDIQTHLLIGEQVGREVISLELASLDFYHLDTCFAPLDDQTVMYYPAALADYSLRAVRHHTADQIEIGPEDAYNFACNCTPVGKTVLLNNASPSLRAELASRGFEILEIPTSEFLKSGGSVACLTLIL
ncbi:MAG: amidinotransferase [Chloroflexota bacterium]|nr:MAG: amidinotransferase [Chloroflexota bacterium]